MSGQGIWVVVGECSECGATWSREQAIEDGYEVAGTVSITEAKAMGKSVRCSECGARFGGDHT